MVLTVLLPSCTGSESSEASGPVHRSLADMIKSNPLQPEINKFNGKQNSSLKKNSLCLIFLYSLHVLPIIE